MRKDHQTNAAVDLKQYGRDADTHWKEVMEFAEKYGFILQAYGGTALLATHRNQLENYGGPEYLRIQQMNGHCPIDCGYAGCLEKDGTLKPCGSCWAIQKGAKWVRFEKNPANNKMTGADENGR